MAEKESTHGLSCPNCGGMVPIPEGQVIVRCPFCDQRSLVEGDTGVQRYQLERRIDRDQASQSMRKFLSGHRAIAGDAARRATLVVKCPLMPNSRNSSSRRSPAPKEV